MKTGTWPVGNERGFTLLELLIVLSVIIMLTFVVSPLQRGMVDNAHFRKTKQEIIAGLHFSRSKAIATQNVVVLTINAADGRMTIADQHRRLHLPENVTLTMNAAPPEQLSEQESAIRFYPDGSSTSLELLFQRDDRVSRIYVDEITGRVSNSEE